MDHPPPNSRRSMMMDGVTGELWAGYAPSIQSNPTFFSSVACSATNKQTPNFFFFSPLLSMEPLIVRPVRTLIRTRVELFLLFLLDRLGSGIRLFTVYSWNGTSHHHESNPSIIMHSPPTSL